MRHLRLAYLYHWKTNTRNIPLLQETLKELWAISEFLLGNDAISVLIGGNYCVKGVDMAYTVTFNIL